MSAEQEIEGLRARIVELEARWYEAYEWQGKTNGRIIALESEPTKNAEYWRSKYLKIAGMESQAIAAANQAYATQHALCEAAVQVRAAEVAFRAAVCAEKETRHIFRAKEKKRVELDAAIDAYTALRGKAGAS